MRGIIVPVGWYPYDYEFDGPDDIMSAVDGDFESVPWLFDDSPAVYVNAHGRENGMMPNRAIMFGDNVADILYGPIFCAGVDKETGAGSSLTPNEALRVMEYFTKECIPYSGVIAVNSM